MKHKKSNTILIGVVLAVLILAVLVVIDRSTGYAILTDNAVMVSQTVPTTLPAGMPATVSIVMKNTGTTTWTAANGYKLGSQNPQDNTLWGTQRVLLTSTDLIKPGQTKTFTFTVTPPATAGVYNFQWRMVKEKVAWFGSKTTNVQVKVAVPVRCGNGLCETGESCEWSGTLNRQILCDGNQSVVPSGGVCSNCIYNYTAPPTACVDTDGGVNYFNAGTCNDGRSSFTDSCNPNVPGRLNEAYCELNVCKFVAFDNACPHGCKNGACLPINSSSIYSSFIPLGSYIAIPNSKSFLPFSLTNQDLASLFDGAITFGGQTYNTAEVLQFGQLVGAPTIQTSLTSGIDAYSSGVYMHVPRDSLKYYYVFDQNIPLTSASPSNVVNLRILGQTYDIATINSNTQFTAYLGAQFYLNVGEKIYYENRTIVLDNVGSAGAIVVSVNGLQETIAAGTNKTVNGLSVLNTESYYNSELSKRAAIITVLNPATGTFNDGDEFVGQNPADPDWVWNVENLQSNMATNRSNLPEYSGAFFGVENDFQIDNNLDNPPSVGNCIDLPNHYASFCVDSLNVADNEYMGLTIEDEDNTDLSAANPLLTSVGTIHFASNKNQGLAVDISNLAIKNGTLPAVLTSNIYLHFIPNSTGLIGVYYTNGDNSVRFAGYMSNVTRAKAQFAHIQEGSANETSRINIVADASYDFKDINITLVPYDSRSVPRYNDNLTVVFNINAFSDASTSVIFGTFPGKEESNEIYWTTTPIGTKLNDTRSRYGIIVSSPKIYGATDQLKIAIPPRAVLTKVSIKSRVN